MARNGKFVIRRGRSGKTHFVLLASNGRGGHERDLRVEGVVPQGIAAVKRLAADASVTEDDATPATTATKRAATTRNTTATVR